MKHIYFPEMEGLEALSLGLEGASKMAVKILSDNTVCLIIQPAGHTPDHQHSDKERVIIMSGNGSVKFEKDRVDIKTGDYLEFNSQEQHQIINNSDKDLVCMCLRNQ